MDFSYEGSNVNKKRTIFCFVIFFQLNKTANVCYVKDGLNTIRYALKSASDQH